MPLWVMSLELASLSLERHFYLQLDKCIQLWSFQAGSVDSALSLLLRGLVFESGSRKIILYFTGHVIRAGITIT